MGAGMPESRGLSCIVAAGDNRAAKAIHGESKVFLEIAGRPLVASLVVTLQQVPQISEVWVVGNRARLEAVFADAALRAEIHKPLYIVEQGRSLLENAWETYRRVISRDPESGRDPEGAERDMPVIYISGDLPFATAQEISVFIDRSAALDIDYACGLVTQASVQDFEQTGTGEPGIEVAFFNLREGRVRQSNLHYASPARIGNLYRIEDMYEHRHQKEFWHMGVLAWKLFFSRAGGPTIVLLFAVMHLAGLLDRWGMRRLSDRLRRYVTLDINERVVSRVLDTRFRFVITEAGGCAIDIDTEHEYESAKASFADWKKLQEARAEALYGPLPLAAGASDVARDAVSPSRTGGG
jgi:GTP:adenosylcobinamide-phosphate guanylyltransferase